MPAEKSKLLEEGQKELRYLRGLKQEILGKMPKRKNLFTKALILLLEEQLNKLEDKIKEAEEKLIEATKASDMVNPEVFDKVKDIIEDVAEGKTDEAIETVKDIAEEEVHKIIEEEVNDEVLAETVKDVIDRTMDGNFDGVVDVLKDGAKDKADEIIDEHVKDEKIAAVLKDVVDGAVDGEWDTLLDIVKDGVVDIAEGKLEEFITKLLNLFEAQINIKLELDMKEEAQSLIPKTLQDAKGKAAAYWTVKLAKDLSIRLMKEAAIIIKEELKRLTSEGGIKELVQIAKEALIETLQSGLAGRDIKSILKELVKNVAENEKFKRIIKNFKAKIVAMFVRIVTKVIKLAVGTAIDAYLRVHSPWSGTLLSTGKRTTKIGPLWGCVSLALSIDVDLKAQLSAERKKSIAIGKATLAGGMKAGIGISIGFDIPLVGDVSIEGGVRVGPEINAYAGLKLESINAVIRATVAPATIDIDVAADLYLETPIPNYILKYVPAYLSSTTVIEQTIYHELGRINILTATTPEYTLKFDLAKGKYNYVKSSGDYNIDASPKVKNYLKDVKEAIEEAAQSVVDAVDPTNWDLNPFDEDGWAGGWF